MQVEWIGRLIRRLASEEGRFMIAVGILLAGLILGTYVWRSTRRLLRVYGVEEAVEGTPFDRTARSLGTSTIGLVASLAALFVYVAAAMLAINVSQLFDPFVFWQRITGFFPNLFIAVFSVIIGFILADKASLVVSERLRSVKFPEVEVLPKLVKYSIFYLAALVALGQLGVATQALLILLAAYAFGLVFLLGLAFKPLLTAGAAGLYLVLSQPYSIGDEVDIDGCSGIVQEVDMLVTRVENDEAEYIIPNHKVFESGIVRRRT
jgi:small-conductance mechanosensitive channel